MNTHPINPGYEYAPSIVQKLLWIQQIRLQHREEQYSKPTLEILFYFYGIRSLSNIVMFMPLSKQYEKTLRKVVSQPRKLGDISAITHIWFMWFYMMIMDALNVFLTKFRVHNIIQSFVNDMGIHTLHC